MHFKFIYLKNGRIVRPLSINGTVLSFKVSFIWQPHRPIESMEKTATTMQWKELVLRLGLWRALTGYVAYPSVIHSCKKGFVVGSESTSSCLFILNIPSVWPCWGFLTTLCLPYVLQVSGNDTYLWEWPSITWEPVRNASSWALPRPTEQRLWAEQSVLCKPSSGIRHMLTSENYSAGNSVKSKIFTLTTLTLCLAFFLFNVWNSAVI